MLISTNPVNPVKLVNPLYLACREENDERVEIGQGEHDGEDSDDDEQDRGQVDEQPRNQKKPFLSSNR